MVNPHVSRLPQERQLAFNPEAPTFNPSALTFQPDSVQPPPQTPSSRIHHDRPGPGTPPPYQGSITSPRGHPYGRAIREAPSPLSFHSHLPPPIETRIPFQATSTVEVVSPSPRKPPGGVKHLYLHPLAQEPPRKDPNIVSPAWRRKELDMAKKNPQWWASLAKANLKALIELYMPNGIPQVIMDTHIEKYKDVYQEYPSLAQPASALAKENATCSADQELPKGIANLRNAHEAAVNAFQNAPRNDYTTPDLGAFRPMHDGATYAQKIDRRATVSTISEETAVPTPHHQRLSITSPRSGQPFSPGPAFPILGQDPDLQFNTPSRRSRAMNTGVEAAGLHPTSYSQQRRLNTTTSAGPEPAHPHWKRSHRGTQQHHPQNYSSTSLENYITPRSARRTNRSGAKVRKDRTPRPKRIDQGPEPSSADIYPDDDAFVAAHEQNTGHFGTDRMIHEAMHEPILENVQEELSGMWTSVPYMSSPPEQFHDVQAQMADPVHAINSTYIPAHSPERGASLIPDGVSDLGYPSPLTTDTYTDPDWLFSPTPPPPHSSRRPKLRIPAPAEVLPMESDQVDGSRYGLETWGLGLHMLGNVWMPPHSKPGTRFAGMGYLWGQRVPFAEVR